MTGYLFLLGRATVYPGVSAETDGDEGPANEALKPMNSPQCIRMSQERIEGWPSSGQVNTARNPRFSSALGGNL